MEGQRFKRGDIVELISGGPDMTVDKYDPPEGLDVTCIWFQENTRHEASFHQDLLEKDDGEGLY